MPSLPPSDPRIYFAAERTLLAWVRSGLAIIGLGFVVARFGLFLTMARNVTGAAGSPTLSTFIGTGFVFIGALIILSAAIQHRRFVNTLTMDQKPSGYSLRFSIASALVIVVMSIILGVYLLASIPKG